MKLADNILVVIPVYNHAATIKGVVDGVHEYTDNILVINDGCSEPIAEIIGKSAAVVTHDKNMGKGQAILTAAAYAQEHGFAYIITLDADGQHFPADLPLMAAEIDNCFGAIIIGVRDFSSDSIPASSKFGRKFGNFWVRLQTGVKVNDIQSGYRAYPVFLLNSIPCFFKTFAFEDEIVVRAIWAGLPFREVPVAVYYSATDRISNFNKLRDNVKLTVLNTYLTIRSFMPWPHKQVVVQNRDFELISQPLKVVKELLAQKNTPLKLALAAGVGIFLGCVPLIGIHTLAIIYIASMLRLSKVIAVAVSHLCMPPLVPAMCIEIGYFLRHSKWLTTENIDIIKQASFYELSNMGLQRFIEWLLGSLVLGPAFAVLAVFIVYVFAIHAQKVVMWKK